jgi:predicted membrane channel-forming protein YqfA (hemolysin III family)
MSIVQLAILLIVIIAISAVVAWFVRSSGVSIPQPLLIAIYAVVAIVVIILIANLAGLGPPLVRP